MDFTTYIDTNFSEQVRNLIKEGQTEQVKGILLGFSLYSVADESGATLLHYSSQYNNANLTQYLLDKGCDVDVQDLMGITPLMIAVMEKHVSVIKILLAAGADIFKLNNSNKSVLHILSIQQAETCDIVEAVFRVLQKKCPTSEVIARKLVDTGCHLFQAIILKDAKVIECMLREGSPVDFTHSINKFAAIHGAVLLDDLKSMKLLVEHGADVNALDGRNENAIYKLYKKNTAHSSEKIEMLRILLARGAKMTSCTVSGVFQAYNILTKGNREAVRMLIESGLNLNIKDNHSDKSVIHYFVYNRDPGVVQELKLHIDKFNVNALDKYRQTPLLLSAYEGNVSMLKFLLKHGASSDIRDIILNVTPLYYAYQRTKLGCEERYSQCGEILLQFRADPQFVTINKNGKPVTIFDAALEKNDIDRIKPVVAHLAIIENLGKPITEAIRTKINSHHSLKEYFEKCQQVLAEKISGKIVLSDLLISSKRKIAKYLNNKSIVRKLQDKRFKLQVSKYGYYYNTLNRLCFKGIRYKKLRNKGARNICRVFQNRIHKTHLIVDKLIDYLNDKSLRQLCKIYHQLPLK